jgi:hypothetical protein
MKMDVTPCIPVNFKQPEKKQATRSISACCYRRHIPEDDTFLVLSWCLFGETEENKQSLSMACFLYEIRTMHVPRSSLTQNLYSFYPTVAVACLALLFCFEDPGGQLSDRILWFSTILQVECCYITIR